MRNLIIVDDHLPELVELFYAVDGSDADYDHCWLYLLPDEDEVSLGQIRKVRARLPNKCRLRSGRSDGADDMGDTNWYSSTPLDLIADIVNNVVNGSGQDTWAIVVDLRLESISSDYLRTLGWEEQSAGHGVLVEVKRRLSQEIADGRVRLVLMSRSPHLYRKFGALEGDLAVVAKSPTDVFVPRIRRLLDELKFARVEPESRSGDKLSEVRFSLYGLAVSASLPRRFAVALVLVLSVAAVVAGFMGAIS